MNMIINESAITARVERSLVTRSEVVFYHGREVIQFTKNPDNSRIALATISECIQGTFKQIVIDGKILNVNEKSLDNFISELIKKEYKNGSGVILGPNPKFKSSEDVVYVEVKENKFKPNSNIGVSVAKIRGIFCIETLKDIVNSGVEKC